MSNETRDLQDQRMVDAFRMLAEPSVPVIEEYVFVKKYLPLFVDNDKEVPVSLWLEVARHPYNPVDVVSNGQVIYRVPPLCKRVNINAINNPRDSVYEMISTYKMKSDVHPTLGDKFLEQKTNELIRKETLDTSTLKQWNVIFARYNLPLIEIPEEGKNTEVVNNKEPDSKPSMVEYEDF